MENMGPGRLENPSAIVRGSIGTHGGNGTKVVVQRVRLECRKAKEGLMMT